MKRKKFWKSMMCLMLAFVIGASGLFAGALPVYGESEAADVQVEESGLETATGTEEPPALESESGTESEGGQEAAAKPGTDVSSEDAAETVTAGDTVPEQETPGVTEPDLEDHREAEETDAMIAPQMAARQAGSRADKFANVVVFVTFKDKNTGFMQEEAKYGNGTTNQDLARKYYSDFNTEKQSLSGYLNAISYGQFQVECYLPQDNGTNIIPCQLPKTYAEYAALETTLGAADRTLIEDLLTELGKTSFPALQGQILDYKTSGRLDNLTIIVDDTNVASGDTWPISHQSEYKYSMKLQNYEVWDYNLIGATTALDVTGPGIICHEFLHSLGYPDLYLSDSNQKINPVYRWDIMAAGYSLSFPLAYLRHRFSGWLTVETVTKDRDGLTLVPATEANGNQAFVLKPPQSSTEFFVVEYRVQADEKNSFYETKVPGTGLIVYRINTAVPGLSNFNASGATLAKNLGVYVHRIPDSTGISAPLAYNSVFQTGQIGNADLSKKEADGAIVYSDDSNSGIVIDNIKIENGKATFDVQFSTAEGTWLPDESGAPDCTNGNHLAMVQAQDGTVYAASEVGSGIRVSALKNGAWTQVGGVISSTPAIGSAVDMTILNGSPVVSVIQRNLKKQMVYQLKNGNWEASSVECSQTDEYVQEASVVGTDFGLFSVVTVQKGSDWSVSLYRYDGRSFQKYLEGLASAEYPVNVQAEEGKDCIYIVYRAFDDGNVLKALKIGKDKSVVPSNSMIQVDNSGAITMTVSKDTGLSYILMQKSQPSNMTALIQYDGASMKEVTSFPAENNVSALNVMMKDGVPYAAIGSSKPNNVDPKTEVYYRKQDGSWGMLGNHVSNIAPQFLYLYNVGDTAKAVLAYENSSNSWSVEHKKYVLPSDGGTVEKPTDPVKPTDPAPTQPTKPTEAPTKPTQPTKPTEAPTKPTSPTTPTSPIKPTNPVKPTDPVKPTTPVKPTNPTTPTSPAKPTEPAAPTAPSVSNASVRYRTHVQSYGDQGWRQDGQMSGTSGEAKRLEGIYIELVDPPMEGKIQYRTHIQSYGWEKNWKENGQMSGTSKQAKRLEAIQIKLTGKMAEYYDVYYRVHAQSYSWLGWAKNGASAGTAGYAKRLEGIEIRLVKKGDPAPGSSIGSFRQAGADAGVNYRTHVQSFGWQAWRSNGGMSGTSGQAKRLEGIEIKADNLGLSGSIQYKTHIQSYGWEKDWRQNGQMSGTSGEAKRLEAIQIRLTGELGQRYDVYYRVHAQSYGWLGWAKNGENAGTAGYAKRLEGIEIRLVEKGGPAPGSTYRAYVSK